MKAFLFPGDRRLEIADLPRPKPGPGEVLIRTKASAICGTDLHLYRQPSAQRAPMAGFCSGHEPVGVVEETGPGVAALCKGDRVVGYHVGGCGRCDPCRLRRFKECARFPDFAMAEARHGSNAEFICLPESQCLPLPDDLSFEEGAVLACNFGTAFGAVKNAFAFPGGTVAIWGMGPVGLCAILAAKSVGLRVLAFDISSERRDLARRLGADEVLDGAGDSAAAVQDLTGGRGAQAVIDTTGMPAVHAALIPAVAVRGTVVLVGIGRDSAVGPVLWAVLKQVTIRGSWIYDIADWPDILDFVRRHRIDLMSVVTEVASPDRGPEMFALADRAQCGKVVFRW